jgi:hypothetical protein
VYVEVVIAESARKHGVPDDDILHAYRNPFQTTYYDEGLSMLIGGDHAGNPLEIGVVYDDETETDVIVHAMPARDHKVR